MATKPKVLLFDESDPPSDLMADRLRLLAGNDYDVIVQSTSSSSDSPIPEDSSLFILPPSHQPPHHHESMDLTILHWNESPSHPGEELDKNVPRFAGMREIDRIIRLHLADRIGPPASRTKSRQLGCHLSFSQARGQEVTGQVIKMALSTGKRLLYLPIKPLYLLEDSFRRGPGQTVGDLLCLIASGDLPDPGALGHWLYLHDRGYFTFRLPDRADALIACDTDSLRRLVHLAGSYAERSGEPTRVWLDTLGLPLDKLCSIAALCDHLYIDIPQGESSAALIARRELNYFLASLPSSCAILEAPSGIDTNTDTREVTNLAAGQ